MTNDMIPARSLGRWAAFFSALFGLGHLAWAAGFRILGATELVRFVPGDRPVLPGDCVSSLAARLRLQKQFTS